MGLNKSKPGTITLTGYKEKDKTPYTVNVGPKHLKVLRELAYYPTQGRTDAELTFGLRLHMAAARRCELRDIGAVRRAGRVNGAWTWKLTDKGRALLARLNDRQEVSA